VVICIWEIFFNSVEYWRLVFKFRINMQKVALIIRDGWGIGKGGEDDMVAHADTPFHDLIRAKYPVCRLKTSGEAVGLPAGFMGSSEVGHLNLGAGRVVIQELKQIDDKLKSGEFFASKNWQRAMEKFLEGGDLHLIGMLQDEGVHGHMAHLFALMRRARQENPAGQIWVHVISDGRDTAPQSFENYFVELEKVLAETGAQIGTIMGRYYAMDRSKNFELTGKCLEAMEGVGERIDDVLAYVQSEYAEGRSDEYVEPRLASEFGGMSEGDVVIHTNFRQDRALQLTQKFLENPQYLYFGFTQYFDEFEDYLLEKSSGGKMQNLLGEVWSRAGLKQLRIAETQKIKHVSSFFDGKSTTPFEGEEIVEVTSEIDPAEFAKYPEMEAYRVTEKFLEMFGQYDAAVINFANCDMVGHTGDMAATKRAVEVVDECVKKCVEALLEAGWEVLITSDHGNAEEMKNPETGGIQTSHSKTDVEMIYVGVQGGSLADGALCDVAPTMLALMGMEIPAEMTGRDLRK